MLVMMEMATLKNVLHEGMSGVGKVYCIARFYLKFSDLRDDQHDYFRSFLGFQVV